MSSLAAYHVQQMERMSSDFFEDGDGLRAVARRTDTVDDIVGRLFEEEFAGEGGGITAIAVGGYGRTEMFPHSDVDLLLLFSKAREAEIRKDKIATLLANLWDSKLRVSHSVRDPRDCTKLAPDNAELHISLLDTRFVAGDMGFFKEFCGTALPKFYLREQKAISRMLSETARKRHRAFGRTLYHLEPNVKEGPGGLRDYHLACWMAQLEHIETDRIPWSEEFLPNQRGWHIDDAKRFLFAVRCYLHYYYGRDRNLLTYDMQDSIANDGAGKAYAGERGASDLMRTYFRNTRLMFRLALRLMDEAATPSNAMLKILRRRISRLSNRDFSVTQGRVFFRDPHALEARPQLALETFAFQARHGLPLAWQTEARIQEYIPAVRAHFAAGEQQWPHLREILSLPHAYRALESMRESGVLSALLPEFELIDCLVIRNFYHRYTVDEHTLVTIRILKDLPAATDPIDRRFADLLGEAGKPDLLYLALLFHDVGKGVSRQKHDEASADLAEKAMRRLGVDDPLDRDTVLQLVRDHAAMSAVMTKRDLSEPEVLESFKARVRTVDRLKLLALMTYADSVAVDPSARSNWRKELLWRLYLGVHGVFQRDHEDKRIDGGSQEDCLELTRSAAERRHMQAFLRGFPERYLRTRAAEQVFEHFRMSRDLEPGRATAVAKRAGADWEVVVLAPDRPFLFASLCGAFSGTGFDIKQAEAFANEAGLVLDSFRVSLGSDGSASSAEVGDLGGFEQRLRRVAEGTLDISAVLGRRRLLSNRRRQAVDVRVSIDNKTSARATIVYVRAMNRKRLLYDLAKVISEHDCDIDLVLCETQGHHVEDVFYIRHGSAKVPQGTCNALEPALVRACAPSFAG